MRQHRMRTAAMPVLATVMLATALSACSTVSAAAVSVRPRVSLADQAVTIRVTGLAPGELATVQVRSTDASGVRWQSSASYRAGAGGELELDRAQALSGSYLGISGMGPIWSMQPEGPDPAGAYFWNAEPLTFTVSVSVERERVAATSFQRRFSSGPFRTAVLNWRSREARGHEQDIQGGGTVPLRGGFLRGFRRPQGRLQLPLPPMQALHGPSYGRHGR